MRYGVEQGFCSETLCIQHDGTPFTEAEADEFEAGDDPCVPVVRLLPESS